MSTLTEFFCWWIIDEQTGERPLTRLKLTRVDAQRAFPGAEPEVQTRETRYLPGGHELPAPREGQRERQLSVGSTESGRASSRP
jgi:hypothetical protein